MAGTSTTSELATMPTEILCMIGDNMSVEEIKGWTLASKKFHEIFLPKLCKHLKFPGNMEELTNSLNAYFTRKTASFRRWAHHHTNLQGVVFDVWFRDPKEASRFISLIRKGVDWHGPEHVYFKKYPEHWDIGQIVGKFKAGTLKGICLPPTSLLDHCGQIARNGANLTSLCLGKYLCIYHRNPPLSVLNKNNEVANAIGKGFPHLESLEIYDRPSRYGLSLYRGYTDSNVWRREIEKAAFILTELRRLRRFAISMCPLESDDISINCIKRQLLAMTKEKGLVPHGVYGPEGVCKLVATYFAAHAKRLEEVCITNGDPANPVFYRATLTGDVWNISKESSEDPSQKYLFPNVLGS
ncbi:hypothetical protein FDENT_10998 [Fusarium denticulatum]|uniref:F-box domain-containing protein n=1 Tax=Fusarium denticulatum TaxID=48507 RepID=A0A8H5TL77_9HYPO|nr:hypothetical protein FDENT_10998 [Fusarium denticulatum]